MVEVLNLSASTVHYNICVTRCTSACEPPSLCQKSHLQQLLTYHLYGSLVLYFFSLNIILGVGIFYLLRF